MLCVKCSTPIPDGSHFCMSCGADVSDPSRLTTASLTDAGVSNMERMLREDTRGEFEIERELGRGGMAVVYLATETHLKRKVAIKVLPLELTFGAGTIERFQREAQTAASLDHPNIIPIYRISTGGELFWYAMKFVEGRALDDILKEKGRFDLGETVEILKQLATALDWAHRRNIIHRDVKPANIMIDEVGRATVTDFGIAKALTSTSLTASGSAIGTPYYMSPEQCIGREITGAADQYSLAVMTFQMLSGQLPFEADSAVELIHKHCYVKPPPLDDLRPQLPAYVYAAVNKALSKKAQERFGTVGDFVDALAGALAEPTTTEVTTDNSVWERASTKLISQVPPRRRKGLVITGAAVVFIVGGVGGWWLLTQRAGAGTEGSQPGSMTGSDSSAAMAALSDSFAELDAPADTSNRAPAAAAQRLETAAPEPQPPSSAVDTAAIATNLADTGAEEEPEARPRAAAPAPAVLVVSVSGGWARISIDGTFRREGRTHRDTLAAGEHTLHLERTGYVTVDTTVALQPGEEHTLIIPMRRTGT